MYNKRKFLFFAERRMILKKCLNKNVQKICLFILICFIIHISMYSLYSAEHHMQSSSAPLVLISYGTNIDSVLPSLDLNKIGIKKFFSIKVQPFFLMNSLIYFPFELYSYQRKNQVVLDKRKYIFKLFPSYLQGNNLKWRNHLSQI